MVFMDAKEPGNPIIFANNSFLVLTGYNREETIGQDFAFLLAHPADSQIRALIETAFEPTLSSDLEIECRRKDGNLFWASCVISPVPNKAGEVVEHFASLVDLSKHIREEARLRFLLDELNHRTLNTLASVQSIALQTLHAPADQAMLDSFEGRLLALSKAHGLLGRQNWEAISLRDVLQQILRPFGLNGDQTGRFSVVGEDVRLTPKAALTLAMTFHELAANATKHGALSNRATGHVAITWKTEAKGRGGYMRLQWQERGGPPVGVPDHKGFGFRLIQDGFPRDMDGEVDIAYEYAGLSCQIALPVNLGMDGGLGDG